MPLSLQHRYAVLLADRTRDVRTITTVVTEVLAANPETSPLDIETGLRAAFGQAYLVANGATAGFQIVLGMPAWHAALADAGLTAEQNWGGASKAQEPVTGAAISAAGPKSGLLTIIPPQFVDRPPHRFLPAAFLPVDPPFDQSLLPFLGSFHEDLVELILDPPIDPLGLLMQKRRINPLGSLMRKPRINPLDLPSWGCPGFC